MGNMIVTLLESILLVQIIKVVTKKRKVISKIFLKINKNPERGFKKKTLKCKTKSKKVV